MLNLRTQDMDSKLTHTHIEQRITQLFAEQEKEAMVLLYQHYGAALFGIVSRIVQQREVSEEVIQDVLVKIWQNASRIRCP